MEFLDYINAGLSKTDGNKAQLARELGIAAPSLHQIIAGKIRMPERAIAKLAIMTNTDPGEIWKAQNAARAETEEEKQLWLPFINRAAAGFAFFCIGAAICVTYTPQAQAQMQNAVKTIFIM